MFTFINKRNSWKSPPNISPDLDACPSKSDYFLTKELLKFFQFPNKVKLIKTNDDYLYTHFNIKYTFYINLYKTHIKKSKFKINEQKNRI